MRSLILAVAMLSGSLFAQDSAVFRNDREGTSFYAGGSFNRAILDVRKDFEAQEMLDAYRNAVKASSSKLCVYDINQSMRGSLLQINRRFNNFTGVVYFLREQNEIDDVAAGILLKANKVVTTAVYEKETSKLSAAGSSQFVQTNLGIVKGFASRYQGQCFDQAYQSLFADLKNIDKKIDVEYLYQRLLAGTRNGTISSAKYTEVSAHLQAYVVKKEITSSTYESFIDDELKKGVLSAVEAQKLKSDYQEVIAASKKAEGKFNTDNLEALLYTAKTKKLISDAVYVQLEQARVNELESSTLTLKGYAQKLKVLRAQFPLRDASERSNFIATKANKVKMSYRQRLFENFNEVQIALMAKMMTDLRRRLESKSISIVIENKDQSIETIPLEPMERFRFSIKKLRSEMIRLSLNSQFNGRSPDYMDLIAASYEVSFIAGSELEQLASLEDIWNPKKTFWDKAQVWLRTFSSVASVVIPPPYGFIPTLILVVIETTVNKDDPNPEDHGSLF